MTAYLGKPTGSNVHWVWSGSAWGLLPYGSSSGGGGSSSGTGSIISSGTLPLSWSGNLAEYVAFGTTSGTLTAFDDGTGYTFGSISYYNKLLTIKGVVFYYSSSTDRTIRASVWNNAGTRVASAYKTILANINPRFETIEFGTASWIIPHNQLGIAITVGIYMGMTGTWYIPRKTDPVIPSSWAWSPGVLQSSANDVRKFIAGDNRPTTNATAEWYPIGPVLDYGPIYVTGSGSTASSSSSTSQNLRLGIFHGTLSSPQGSSSLESVGMTYLDQTQIATGTRRYYFKAILAASTGSTIAYADLYDYNGIINGIPQPISGSVVTGSSATFTYLTKEITTIMSSVTGSGIIEARIWCTPTGTNNQSICKNARLEIDVT